MKGKATRVEGQIAVDGIKSTKDSGILAIEGNDIEIITAVAETTIATLTRKNGTQEVIVEIAETIADTMMAGEIELLTGAIAKSEETMHPIKLPGCSAPKSCRTMQLIEEASAAPRPHHIIRSAQEGRKYEERYSKKRQRSILH